jgi:hypothetical protein
VVAVFGERENKALLRSNVQCYSEVSSVDKDGNVPDLKQNFSRIAANR